MVLYALSGKEKYLMIYITENTNTHIYIVYL